KPCKLTASEALGKIQVDEISVQEYAESLLERIEARDGDVKAWAYLDEKRVMQEARLLDEIPKKNRGPLHGLPIAVKDVIYTKDMPTQFNSPLYDGHFPETDAASVRILRHAGALIVGKTTTTEFAAIHVGPKTHNPHDPLRTPGGSSSGSGAAVADFQAPMALGTQTGGSLIRPASFNGLYGFKPTWNSVSREGQKIYALMYDTLGLHVPVLNVPGFKGDHDMPIGLSFVAPQYRGCHLLDVGKAVSKIFEAEEVGGRIWRKRRRWRQYRE
ncbi:Glutamyl-tRNA(Gln) amidotransferase subunit A 1, partial [Fusarium oxysporum f. sp. cubense race 1]